MCADAAGDAAAIAASYSIAHGAFKPTPPAPTARHKASSAARRSAPAMGTDFAAVASGGLPAFYGVILM